MCGRYALNPGTDFYSRYPTQNRLSSLQSFTTASPGQFLPVIIQDNGLIIDVMRWGLIPQWAKNLDIGSKLFNARSETVMQKPSFKSSFVSCRCLVPCSAFYESRQLFGIKGTPVFSLAGLYSKWESETGDYLPTFTIITTQANDLIKPFHDRMPVILAKESESIWLDPQTSSSRLLSLLRPFSDDLAIKS